MANAVAVLRPAVTEIPMYEQTKLSQLMRFSRVAAGSNVIDVYPGDGDWTRLFSDIVGRAGRATSFVPAEVAHFKGDPVGRMRMLAKEPGRENVNVVSADLLALGGVTQPAHGLWMHLFYHDLHTALMQAKGATAAAFNRAVYERMKPGGVYVIVDHVAAGAGTSDTQALHRIDPVLFRKEVDAAGFMLDEQSLMLATRTMRTRPRRSTPRSRARPIASPIGSGSPKPSGCLPNVFARRPKGSPIKTRRFSPLSRGAELATEDLSGRKGGKSRPTTPPRKSTIRY